MHILVNPTQLSDIEFTAWMDRASGGETKQTRKQTEAI